MKINKYQKIRSRISSLLSCLFLTAFSTGTWALPELYSFTLISLDDISIPVPVEVKVGRIPDRNDLDINKDGLADRLYLPQHASDKGYIFLADGKGSFRLSSNLENFGGFNWSKDTHNITLYESAGQLNAVHIESKTSGGMNAIFGVSGSSFVLAEKWNSPKVIGNTITTVGATEGHFAVTNTGAATYTVPIEVPDGINGLQPKVELQYNSQDNSQGLAGIGWSLNGLSYIHRCNSGKTTTDTSYDLSNNSYCLDGKKLKYQKTVGAKVYYKTEIDSMQNIVGITQSGIIQRFEIYGKDKIKRTYGGSANARVAGKKNAYQIWALSEVRDLAGNYIKYSYTTLAGTSINDSDSARLLPKKIEYTGNANLSPRRTIEFVFDKLPTQFLKYRGGARLLADNILTEIRVYINSELISLPISIRTYYLQHMSYDSNTKIVLTSLKECSGEGGCYKPTVFTSDAANTTVIAPVASATALTSTTALNNIVLTQDEYANAKFVDLNNDGLTDILAVKSDGINTYLRNKNNSYDAAVVTSISACANVNGFDHRCMLGDFNGDANLDILAYGGINSSTSEDGNFYDVNTNTHYFHQIYYANAKLYLGDSAGKFSDSGQTITKAFTMHNTVLQNGGVIKYSSPVSAASYIYAVNSTYFDSISIQRWNTLADMDGDGYSDLFQTIPRYAQTGSINKYWLDFRIKYSAGAGSFSDQYIASKDDSLSVLGDVANNTYLYTFDEYDGTSPTPQIVDKISDVTVSLAKSNAGFKAFNQLADFNGDGLMDIIRINPSTGDSGIFLKKNNRASNMSEAFYSVVDPGVGGAIFNSNTETYSRYFEFTNQIVDINGDQIPDIVRVKNSGTRSAPVFTDQMEILYGRGDGTFTDALTSDITLTLGGPLGLANLNSMNAASATARGISQYNMFIDVNGDHRADYLNIQLIPWPPYSLASYSLQLGKGDGTFGSAVSLSFVVVPAFVKLVDIDNDAHIDMVYKTTTGISYRKNYSHNFLINKIEDGLGREIHIEHKYLTDVADADQVDCGVAEAGNNHVMRTTPNIPVAVASRYQYTRPSGTQINKYNNLTYKYGGSGVDTQRKEWLGFRCTHIQNNDTNILVKNTFHQVFPKNGLLERSATYTVLNGVETLASEIKNQWDSQLGCVGVDCVAIRNTSQLSYEKDGSKSSYVEKKYTTYDEWLNPVLVETDYHDGTVTTNIVNIDYAGALHVNGEYPGFVLADSIAVVDKTAGGNASRYSRNVYEYDVNGKPLTTIGIETVSPLDISILTPDQAKVGLEAYLNAPTSAPSDKNIFPIWRKTVATYDPYGQVKEIASYGFSDIYDANGAIKDGLAPAIRTTKQYFSGVDGETINDIYPVLYTVNEYGHQSRIKFDSRWNHIVEQADVNNIITSYEYDAFGRIIKENYPEGSYLTYDYREASPVVYASADESLIIDKTLYGATGIIKNTDVLDAQGRTLVAEKGNFQTNVIRKSFRYSPAHQKLEGQSRWGNAVIEETYVYDGQLRVDTVTHVNGTKTKVNYSNNPNGLPGKEILGHVVAVTRNGIGLGNLSATRSEQYNGRGEVAVVTDAVSKKTSYSHGPFGVLLEVQEWDAAGNAVSRISNEYDAMGRKIKQIDPDMGVWEYHYNSFGELEWQKDAKGQVSAFSYDKLGRLSARREGNVAAVWEYDQALGKGKGAISKVIGKDALSGMENYSELYQYDNQGRVRQVDTSIKKPNGIVDVYTVKGQYDNLGRVDTLTYPARSKSALDVKYSYDRQYLTGVGIPGSPTKYWQASAYNNDGKLAKEIFGNNVETITGYFPDTGLVESIFSSTATRTVQSLDYRYDGVGNLIYRNDLKEDLQSSVEENYDYDQLSRLTKYDLNFDAGTVKTAVLKEEYSYKRPSGTNGSLLEEVGNGNIYTVTRTVNNQTSVESYTYGAGIAIDGAGPHAVKSINGSRALSFTYDGNGNMASKSGQLTIAYTAFNKPSQINGPGGVVAFEYSPSYERVLKYTSTKSEAYVGGLYEHITEGTAEKYRFNIYANGKLVATETQFSSGVSPDVRYMHTDHQGSIHTITAQNLTITTGVQRLSFDPWGKIRNPATGFSNNITLPVGTDYGYTGQEMDYESGLINMGGRIYDPDIKRFITADPFVTDVFDPRSLNRYSYVYNNPLSNIDPSGFASFSLTEYDPSGITTIRIQDPEAGIDWGWVIYQPSWEQDPLFYDFNNLNGGVQFGNESKPGIANESPVQIQRQTVANDMSQGYMSPSSNNYKPYEPQGPTVLISPNNPSTWSLNNLASGLDG